MSCADTTAHASLEQLFTGELSADALVALRAHAQECTDCRAAYDKLTRIEAQLEKSKSGLPTSRMEFLQAQVLARAAAAQSAHAVAEAARDAAQTGGAEAGRNVDAAPGPDGRRDEAASREAPARSMSSAAPESPLWARLRMWLLPAGGLALAGVLALVLLPRTPPGVDADGYQARGTGAGDAAIFGVRAFCVEPATTPGTSPKIVAEAGPDGALQCAIGNRVQFSYTAPKAALLTVAAPTPNGDWLTFTSNTSVKKGTDVPLSFSTPVTESWLSRPIAVKARFADPADGKLLAESSVTLKP